MRGVESCEGFGKFMKPIKLNRIETVSFMKIDKSNSFIENFYLKQKNKIIIYFWFLLLLSAALLHTHLQFKVKDTEMEVHKLKKKAVELRSSYNALLVDIENLKRPSKIKEFVKTELNMVDTQPYENQELDVSPTIIAKYEQSSFRKQIKNISENDIKLAFSEKCMNKLSSFIEVSQAISIEDKK